jgi:hypothetical protein
MRQDTKTYVKDLKASNLARLLGPAEADIAAGRTKPIRAFLREFKLTHKISVRISRRNNPLPI